MWTDYFGLKHLNTDTLVNTLAFTWCGIPISVTKTIPRHDWLLSFETCAVINGWSDDVKCKFIDVSMRGRAINIFRELDGAVRSDFTRLKHALKLRFVSDIKLELLKSEFLTHTR